ncbi:hypothetical protein KW783_03710 [Candidatus Parcubacteria bacterium]|nr:hypothetical protein [Candidatus Parcubacteria bacterium]
MWPNFYWWTGFNGRQLPRIPKKVYQVCGPISTGGLGSMDANVIRFRFAICELQRRGYNVFDQMPLQSAIVRVMKVAWREPGYCLPIMDAIYRGIFASGYVDVAIFLPDWLSSVGTRDERKMSHEFKIQIEEYPENWLRGFKSLQGVA